jgi:hypothetical protein
MGWYKDTIKMLSGTPDLKPYNHTIDETTIKRQLINNMLYDNQFTRFRLDSSEDFSYNQDVVEKFILDFAKRHNIGD